MTITAVNGQNGLNAPTLGANAITVSDTGAAGGSFNYVVSDGALTDPTTAVNVTRVVGVINGTVANEIIIGDGLGTTINGGGGNDIIDAGDGGDTITAGLGNDVVQGGTGNDVINWNANATGPDDGFDRIDGGAGAVDTFQLTGNAQAETFRIYTGAAATLAGIVVSGALTEIVVTRTVGLTTTVIAELDNIEEIRIQTTQITSQNPGGLAGGDTFQIIGNFAGTSLNFNTITIDGNAGDDTVDISSLTSAHRIVFRSNGGNDTIVGTLRAQDVIELPEGTVAGDFEESTDNNGLTTLSDGTHTISYVATGAPQLVEHGYQDNNHDGQEDGEEQDDDEACDPDDDQDGEDGGSSAPSPSGSNRVMGTPGEDVLVGTSGGDLVFGGAGNDLLAGSINDGNDLYYGGDISEDDGVDTLELGFLTVDAQVDLGTGVGGRGSAVSSQSGTDALWGVENVVTGSGNDTITASNAVNVMDGGDGNDVFVFGSSAAANGDTIRGFQAGDRIDLSGIDANTGMAGNQAFTLQSGQATTAPAQIVVTHETREDGEYTIVTGNTGNDNAPELRISLEGNHTLTNADFNL
ncbi:MAG: hypothetical protein EOP02_07200 [Proteobacteria bacterium]|nr:MAG: hypothetical protein EOP02_07200 [Pseudomonadota bacterium]